MSVLIIGGGPAGLSLAQQLAERKIDYILLEKSPQLGSTFRSMAANTTLGPWLNNVLPGTRPSWRIALRRADREEYAQYLSEYAIQRDLQYVTSVQVLRVTRRDDRFHVITSRGEFTPRVVVNATGYFSNPYVPEIPGAMESEIQQLHAAYYREPENVRQLLGTNRGRVLVVGGRMTAGETVESLYRAGFEVCLSHRSPLQFSRHPMLEACISPFSYVLEEAMLHFPGLGPPMTLESRMGAGPARRLLEWGLVHCFPAITRFEKRKVVFSDGRELEADLVLYATGYRPALKHLEGLVRIHRDTGLPSLFGMESQETRGLFFLGLDGLRSFRSRFLRGIREDAAYLADWLQRYWFSPLTELVESSAPAASRCGSG